MIDEHHNYRSSVKKSMQCLWNMPKESSPAFPNKPKQFGLVSSVSRFLFQDALADRNQHLGPRARLQGSVVDQGNQLRRDQYRDRRFVSRALSEPSKDGVGPVSLRRAHSVALHEPLEHQGVYLLFLDEMAGDRDKALLSELVRKCRRKREQAMAFRVLTKLKLGYRTFDARSLVGGEDITPVVPRNQVGCRSIGIKVR
jgi:hypothetical protein